MAVCSTRACSASRLLVLARRASASAGISVSLTTPASSAVRASPVTPARTPHAWRKSRSIDASLSSLRSASPDPRSAKACASTASSRSSTA
jgi:hypothetical protein